MTTAPLKPTPDTPAETIEECFLRLAAAWHRGTYYLSSMEEAKRPVPAAAEATAMVESGYASD